MSRHGTARGSAANRRSPVAVESNEAFEAFYRKQGVVAEEIGCSIQFLCFFVFFCLTET